MLYQLGKWSNCAPPNIFLKLTCYLAKAKQRRAPPHLRQCWGKMKTPCASEQDL